MRRSTRVFDALLRLYPADFRDEYGREIVLVFADRYRDARGPLQRAGVWLEAAAGVIQEAPKEHIRMFWQDLRYAARALRANPLFAGMVVLALALGIGANSAIFSVLNAVVLRTLPVAHPEQLYLVKEDAGPNGPNRVSWPQFERLREAAPGQLAAMNRGVAMLYAGFGSGSQEAIAAQLVSGEFFEVLGVPAVRGRVLGREDNLAPGAHPVAVISYGCWQRRYGGSPDVVGREVSLNGARFSIVGVAQEGFTGVWLESPTEVWLPVAMQHDVRYKQNYSASNANTNEPWMKQDRIEWLLVMARAPAGSGPLQSALNVRFQQGRAERAEAPGDPQARKRFIQARIALDPFAHGNSRLRERFTEPLYLLMAMAGLVLAIACANAANLLLARATARQKEIALRLSLGAGRIRLFRQLLTESLLLVSVASVAALAIGRWTSEALVRMATSTATGPAPFAAALDWRVLAFTASVALATAVLFGVAPAVRATRIDPAAALKSGGRSISGSSGRAPRALVVMQVALSLVLVVGAGLLVRSVRNALDTPLGFEREHVLSVACDPRLAGYRGEQLPALYDRLQQRVGAVPGVRSVALAMCGILSGCRSASSGMSIEGYDRRPGENIVVVNNLVTPGYFDVVGMRLREGRLLNERDRKGVAVVNQAFLQRYAGGRTLLGRKFGEDALNFEIVGVVEDARVLDVKAGPEPMAYSPLAQVGVAPRSIEVRTEGDPRSIAVAVRRAIAEVEPRLPIESVTTLSERVNTNLTQDRLLLSLFSAFGTLALGLAGFGLFGLLSYAVARRREEFGVRMALGATPSVVLWNVVRESLLLAGIGIAAGAPLVIAGAQAMRSLLFGVSPRDGITMLGAAGLLLAIAAIAGLLPAWRASRVDPLTALRSE